MLKRAVAAIGEDPIANLGGFAQPALSHLLLYDFRWQLIDKDVRTSSLIPTTVTAAKAAPMPSAFLLATCMHQQPGNANQHTGGDELIDNRPTEELSADHR